MKRGATSIEGVAGASARTARPSTQGALRVARRHRLLALAACGSGADQPATRSDAAESGSTRADVASSSPNPRAAPTDPSGHGDRGSGVQLRLRRLRTAGARRGAGAHAHPGEEGHVEERARIDEARQRAFGCMDKLVAKDPAQRAAVGAAADLATFTCACSEQACAEKAVAAARAPLEKALATSITEGAHAEIRASMTKATACLAKIGFSGSTIDDFRRRPSALRTRSALHGPGLRRRGAA